MERRVDITDVNVVKTVQFSYSVEWVEETLEWKDRMTRYADSRFLPGSFEIHWLSIINSFVLVLLLTAFLTIILLRVLKNDFSRYMELDDDALEEEEVSQHLVSFVSCLSYALWLTLGLRAVWMEVDPR
jgi:Endomembrane protein 70